MIATLACRHFRTIALVIGWITLIFIAAASLPPLRLRPHLGVSGDIERGIAFIILGLAFSVACPRWPLLVGAILVGFAGSIELLQALVADVHQHAEDLIVKSFGVVGGVALGTAINDELQAVATPKFRARE
jgi:hypothetical protein